MKKLFLLFLSTTLMFTTSCSSDDDNNTPPPAPRNTVTKANILVLDLSDNPMQNVTVYAQSESNWDANGGASSTNANFEVTTGADGIAKFDDLYTEADFNSGNNFTNVYRFSVFINTGTTTGNVTVGQSITMGEEVNITLNSL
ncbi:hypothetical protein ACFSQP_10130 [Bizionia sediminis]|uniref:Uncharacterized protein n=1 Tax=Bizionia sediminis TaxID=1737064 RepID=A0ABW5KUN7_9FLAO